MFSSQNAELVLALLRSTQTTKYKAVCFLFLFFNSNPTLLVYLVLQFRQFLSVYMFCVIKLTSCSPPSASFEHANISLSRTLSLLFTMLADNYKHF